MSSATLMAFWAFSLLFVFTPGADWAYAIAAGIRGRGVMAAVGGLLAGYVVLTLVVAAGFGMLIAGNRLVMLALTVFGALYLTWLGISLLRNPPVPRAVVDNSTGSDRARLFLRGALVSGLNPKAFLFFLAFLPPWTNVAAAWSLSTQIVVLGLLYTTSCAVVYSIVGIGAGAMLATRPAAARVVGRVSGLMMLALAVLLLCKESAWL
ncbi:LysE family translocator [Pseudomonas sp. BN102]|uniref:LysE family translocator n=1 Tax=Pseudomonas sp. BN102 TaxID=2567886 RepID=UPI00245599DD|nr:LysE family translocator [Pseudomonas sp. BN102]MDH4612693.1 LysE family translocator [Pseudomonas sp. BN102]